MTVGYNEERRQVQIANSEGLLTADDRTRVRLGVHRGDLQMHRLARGSTLVLPLAGC